MQVRVLKRMRLGNVTEDITSFVGRDPLSSLAILDGYEVLQVVVPQTTPDPPTHLPVQPLCKLFQLGLTGGPNGIAFIETERLFVVNSSSEPTKLFLFDQTGQPQGTRIIQRPTDFPANHVEGLTHLPQRSLHYPDHLVMVAKKKGVSRLEIIDRDGKIAAAIFEVPEFLTGVAFKNPDSLLVSREEDDLVREIDFEGNVIRESKTTSDTFGGEFYEIEGLTQARNQSIAAVNFFLGRLAFLDRDLNLTALQSIDYRIGPGLFAIGALAWDSTLNQYLLISNLRDNPPGGGDLSKKRYISAVRPAPPQGPGVQPDPPTRDVPLALDAARRIVEAVPGTGRMTYLPDEKLIAVVYHETPAPTKPAMPKQFIRLFNEQGTKVEEINVTALGVPGGIAYVSTNHQFIVRFGGTVSLTVLTRKGEFVRTIELSQTLTQFSGFTFFDPGHPSGGQFVFLNASDSGDAVVTDFEGKSLGTFRQADAAIVSTNITAITSGADTGALAILDDGDSALVVFRLL